MDGARLNLVVIYTRDLERTRAFYERLGLRFASERQGRGLEHYAAEIEGLTLEIYPATSDEMGVDGVRLGFEVGDIHDLLDKLLEAGARLVSEAADSPWGWRAVISDWEGRRIELLQPQRRRHCCG